MPVGHFVTRVQAVDNDEHPYNAEVYYTLQSRTSLISINRTSGVITLQENLSPRYRNLVFTIIANDGGSPRRMGKTRLTLTVKIISAPRDIVVAQTGDRWAMLCWLPSSNGNPMGYIIYLISQTDFMTSSVAPAPFITTQHNITREELGQRNNRICTALTDLESWSDFEARLAGWDAQEIGKISQPVTFDTRVNRSCYNLDNSNFKCTCLAGFYGDDCSMFNPCSSTISPCLNGGSCISIANNHFECACPPRFKGNSCEIFNPCSQSACENGGLCYNISKSAYGCKCPDGFTGAQCETNIDECSSEPCQNGGLCIDNVGAFKCVCTSGFEGDYCEDEINECSSWPCKNGGTCVDEYNGFTCNCPYRFIGKTCDAILDVCASNPCNNGGTCIETRSSFRCQCLDGFKGQYCETKEKCFSENNNSSKGVITWPEVDFGSTVKLNCPNSIYNDTAIKTDTQSFVYLVFNSADFHLNLFKLNPNGGERYNSTVMEKEYEQKAYALRSCSLINGSATWGTTAYGTCLEEDFLAVVQISQHFKNLSKIPSQMNSETFIDVATHLPQILSISLTNRKIAQNLVTIFSNMLEVNNSVLEEVDRNRSISQELINLINKFTSEVNLNQDSSIAFSSINLHINVTLIDAFVKNLTNGISYSPSYTTKVSDVFEGNLPKKSQMMSINIPQDTVQKAVGKSPARIQFVSYRNKKLFRPLGRVAMFLKNGTRGSDSKGQVITASVGQMPVYNLRIPIVYKMPNLHVKRKQICVYWDPEVMEWLTKGVLTNQTKDWVVCKSTHLTAFSVLLDVQMHKKLLPITESPLTIVTLISVLISVVALLLTIFTYSLFRCLDRNHTGKILLNLCTSMLFMNVSFLLLSVKEYTGYRQEDVCLFAGVSSHYFVLTTLAWMFVEAVNMYQLLITIYESSGTLFMAKRFFLTWGLPMCIVAGTIYHTGLSYYKTRDPDWCLFTPIDMNVYYITYIGPVCIIIFTNTIVFIMVNRVLLQRRTIGKTDSKKQSLSAAQVRGSFTVMVLLGIAWIPGIFAVGDFRLVFQYTFCIANSLQCIIIFVVRCVICTEARNAWMRFLRIGHLKNHNNIVAGGIYREPTQSSSSDQEKHATDSTDNEKQWRIMRPKSNYEKYNVRGMALECQRQPSLYTTSVTLPYPKQSITPIIGSCMGRSRSLHIDECNSKEGEDTSWQFLAPISTIAPTDQGYGTAEHSPESPRQQQRHQPNPTHFSVSTPEQLHSTSSPRHLMAPTICAKSDSDLAQSPSVSLHPHTIFQYSLRRESGSSTTEPPSSSLCSSTPSPSTSSSIPPTLSSYGAQIWSEMPLININSHKVREKIHCEELL